MKKCKLNCQCLNSLCFLLSLVMKEHLLERHFTLQNATRVLKCTTRESSRLLLLTQISIFFTPPPPTLSHRAAAFMHSWRIPDCCPTLHSVLISQLGSSLNHRAFRASPSSLDRSLYGLLAAVLGPRCPNATINLSPKLLLSRGAFGRTAAGALFLNRSTVKRCVFVSPMIHLIISGETNPQGDRSCLHIFFFFEEKRCVIPSARRSRI